MKPSNRVPLAELRFVTVTSKVQFLLGPPFFVVISAVIVSESTTITEDALGDGPQPFSNVTEAPASNPLPPMVTDIVVALPMESGIIEVTDTPGKASTTRLTELEEGDVFPAKSV